MEKTNGKNKQVFRSDWSAGRKHCYLSLPVPVDYVQHALLAVSDLLVLSPSLAPDLAKLADRSMFCICKVIPTCGSIAPYVSRISFQSLCNVMMTAAPIRHSGKDFR